MQATKYYFSPKSLCKASGSMDFPMLTAKKGLPHEEKYIQDMDASECVKTISCMFVASCNSPLFMFFPRASSHAPSSTHGYRQRFLPHRALQAF